jgi:hypothetical protein
VWLGKYEATILSIGYEHTVYTWNGIKNKLPQLWRLDGKMRIAINLALAVKI